MLLKNKKILITGVLSERSIAYSIVKAALLQGAEVALTYQNDKLKQRVIDLGEALGVKIFIPCDVSDDAQINQLFTQLQANWQILDGIVHSIAYAPKEGLSGNFVTNVGRDTFNIANDISAYSFSALARYAQPMLHADSSLLTLTYLGGSKVVPNYNMAGVAKAALEATMRYMAYSLGDGGIRVNAISAGPIKTLAASGIAGFSKILEHVAKHAPLKRNVTAAEVANSAVFLLSDLASAITGEILHVDAGFNIMASNPAFSADE